MKLSFQKKIKNKKQRHYFANTGLSSQSYGFSSSHVWMWEMDYKESWVPKNWCFWTVVLEKTLESPLDCMEIQPVSLKRNQSWIFIGRTEVELKLPYTGHLMWRTTLFEKTLTLRKIEGRRRRGWQRMRWLDGIIGLMDMSLCKLWEWWWTGKPGCCSPWGCKELDTTDWLNWSELNWLNNFQVYNTVLLIIVPGWYIRAPELIDLIARYSYSFPNILFPPLSSLWQPPFYFSFTILWVEFF